MRRIGYLLFTIVCIFFFPLVAHAECDYQRMSELNKIAGNVQIKFSYETVKNAEGRYERVNNYLNFLNITNDIYVVDDWGVLIEQDGAVSYDALNNIGFSIYSKDVNCYGEKISKKYIDIPHVNTYYFTDDCRDNPNFKYCSLWLNSNYVDYDAFKKELSDYKNKKIISSEKASSNKKLEFDFMTIGIVISVLLLVVLTGLIIRRRRKLK